jgi:hypothetical protein
VEEHGDIAPHGRKVDDAARAQDMYGFTDREVDAWLSARCFSAQTAYDLSREGFSHEQTSILTDAWLGNYKDPIGFKVSKGDLSISGALEAGRYV